MYVVSMIIAGVTGGIGSGKTAVCRLLEKHGAEVFYADEVARQLMQTDEPLRREIVHAFGSEAYQTDGSLNRSHLSDIIFRSNNDRLRMNALVHPAVGRAFEKFVEQARLRGTWLAVKEAALLFETGRHELDVVVVVEAPETDRIDRVMKRDGLTRKQIEARMATQMPAEEMRKRTDFVVDNSGDQESLENQVEELLEKIRRFCA